MLDNFENNTRIAVCVPSLPVTAPLTDQQERLLCEDDSTTTPVGPCNQSTSPPCPTNPTTTHHGISAPPHPGAQTLPAPIGQKAPQRTRHCLNQLGKERSLDTDTTSTNWRKNAPEPQVPPPQVRERDGQMPVQEPIQQNKVQYGATRT